MVMRWGMSEKLGMVQYATRQNAFLGGSMGGDKPYSDETARMIDAEVQAIIHDSHADALRMLTAHRRELDALASALLSRETLDEAEILSVTGLPPAPALASQPLVPRADQAA
jgi:cell division protease FtsH